MSSENITASTIRNYLLGTLDETTTEGLDELSITDQSFGDRIAAEQYEIVDEWVVGELSPADRTHFEAALARSPALRAKVAISRALAAAPSRAVLVERPAVPSLLARLFPAVPRFAYGLAAAAVMVGAVVGLYFVFNPEQGREIAIDTPQRTETPIVNTGVVPHSSEDSPAVSSNPTNTENATRDKPRLSDAANRRPPPPPREIRSVIALVLAPPTRGASQIRSVRIGSDVKFLDLNVQTEAATSGPLRIEIGDATGKVEWSSKPVAARPGSGRTSVRVRVPTSRLGSGIRMIRLRQSNADRAVIDEHVIRVVR